MNNYLLYGLLIFYLVGYAVHFYLFTRDKNAIQTGWGLVFTGAYFSIISWIAVIMFLAFESKAQPPKWLIGDKNRKP